MQCKFIKNNNEQCEANAMENGYCFTHNPNMAKERMLANARGGKTPKKVFTPLKLVRIKDSKGAVNLLTKTINEVRGGEIDIRIANCIGYLAGQLIKALEVADVENRIEEIERIIFERKKILK